MYIGHARLYVWLVCLPVCLSVYVSVPRSIPTLLYEPGCKLGEWSGVPSSDALLGGFAIGARISLLWQQPEREVLASACTRSMPGFVLIQLFVLYKIKLRLETVSIAKPLQNRQHAQNP